MAVERVSGGSSLIDVLDRVLDKGIVIDAWVRISLVGIDLITVEARVVVASSDKAYDDQPALQYREDTTLNGRYPYDASKVCPDVLARSCAATYDLPVALTRCANRHSSSRRGILATSSWMAWPPRWHWK